MKGKVFKKEESNRMTENTYGVFKWQKSLLSRMHKDLKQIII